MTLAMYTVIRAHLDAPRATASWPASWFGSRRVGERTVDLRDAYGRRMTSSGVPVTLGGVTVPSVAGVATFPSDRYEADPALAGLPVTLRAGLAGEACVDVLKGRRRGRGPQITSSPNGFDWMRKILVEHGVAEYVAPAEREVCGCVGREHAIGPVWPACKWCQGNGEPRSDRLVDRDYFGIDQVYAPMRLGRDMQWLDAQDSARTAELARRATREYDAPGPDLGGPARPVPYGVMEASGARKARGAQFQRLLDRMFVERRAGHRDEPAFLALLHAFSGQLPRAPVADEIARLVALRNS